MMNGKSVSFVTYGSQGVIETILAKDSSSIKDNNGSIVFNDSGVGTIQRADGTTRDGISNNPHVIARIIENYLLNGTLD